MVDDPFEEQHFYIHILTYDVRTAMAGSIEVPKRALPQYCKVSNLHLASSPDGREAELARREQAQDIRLAAAACRRRRLVAARRDRHSDDRKVSDAAGHAVLLVA